MQPSRPSSVQSRSSAHQTQCDLGSEMPHSQTSELASCVLETHGKRQSEFAYKGNLYWIYLHLTKDTRPPSAGAEASLPAEFTLQADRQVQRQDKGPSTRSIEPEKTQLRAPSPASAPRVTPSNELSNPILSG
jgi:hypothetical protein